MRKLKMSIKTIFYIFFIILLPNQIFSQSTVDSIINEVELLEKYYQDRLTILYEAMIAARKDTTLVGKERYNALQSMGYFVVEENIHRLLDSIDYEIVSINDDEGEILPFYKALFGISMRSGSGFWHLMPFILKSLDKPRNNKQLYLHGDLIRRCYNMRTIDTAACLRIIANSIRGVSRRKENLLRIADILENK